LKHWKQSTVYNSDSSSYSTDQKKQHFFAQVEVQSVPKYEKKVKQLVIRSNCDFSKNHNFSEPQNFFSCESLLQYGLAR
jgi:hypothetical protein